jgi:hypothetical protein
MAITMRMAGCGLFIAAGMLSAVAGPSLLWVAPTPPAPLPPPAPPTPIPPPTPFATAVPSLGERALSFLEANWPLVGLGAAPLLIALAISLLVWAARAGKARPSAPRGEKVSPTAPLAGPMTGACLESSALPGGSHRFRLEPNGTVVGRAVDCDLVVTRQFPAWETVSRRHARLFQQAGRWIVEDLSSTNGVYVDGQRTGRNVLYDGCRLGIGGVEFIFRAETEEARR